MDSFELNKVMGAILATCLVLLISSFTASAIFAPVKPEKPGYDIAVKQDEHAGQRDRNSRDLVAEERDRLAEPEAAELALAEQR